MSNESQSKGLEAAGGYGPPGGGGYGGGPPGGYGGPPGGFGPPPGGFGPPGGPPPGGYGPPGGPPPGGYGPPGMGGPPPGFGPPMGGGPMMGGPKVHPLAIVSLITGILSLPACCCWFFGFPLPICAIVCAIIGLGKIKANPQMFKGGGMCVAGMVCGGFGLLMTVGAQFTSYDDDFRSRFGY
jgi:hypothetical protein